MAYIPTKAQVEAKTRRDTIVFVVSNARAKTVKFAKSFVNNPSVVVTMSNGHPDPEISNITANGFKLTWAVKGNYEGRWEAFPQDDDDGA